MANLSNINNKFLFTDGDFLKIGNLAPINNISGTESGISVTNSNVASIALDNTAASGKTFVIYSDDGGKLNFYDVDASSGRLVIDSSGNVGIGTGLPSSKLEIAAANSQVRLTDTDDSKFVLYSYSGGKLIVRNNSVNTTTNQFTLTEDGKFGIGTISPDRQLEVYGVNDGYMKFDGGRAGNHGFTIGSELSGFVIYDDTLSTYRFVIDQDSGNVGIGTTAPQALLDVSKNNTTIYDPTDDLGQRAGTATIHIANQTATTNTFGQLMYDSRSSGQGIARIVFLNGGSATVGIAFVTEHSEVKSEKMRIQSNGNVGIGTNSPGAILELNDGSTQTELRISVTGDTGYSTLNFADASDINPGQIYYHHQSNLMNFRTNDNDRMRITSGGQVQVGYFNTARGGGNTTFMTGKSGTTYLELNGGDVNGEGGLLFADGSGGNYGLINYSHVSDLMQFYTASGERMRITSAGNVAIGGTLGADSQFRVELKPAGTILAGLRIGYNGTSNNYFDGDNQYFRNGLGSINRMVITSGGRVLINNTNTSNDAMCHIGGNASNYALYLYADVIYASNYRYQRFRSGGNIAGGIEGINQTSVTYNTSSDYRMKKNIKPLENGLERLSKLKPVKFDWKLNNESTEGFIAHEVQDIFPDAISGEKDGEDMQGMDYGRITPLLVAAIQELKADNDSLKARIETLENK